MYNSNLSKLMIVVLGLNASLINAMDDEIKKNEELINSQAVEYVAKLKGQIQEKVAESFSDNSVLPASDLADIVSEYAVISQEELHKLNKQLLKAAKHGDIKVMEEALENGADVNYVDYKKDSPISPLFEALLAKNSLSSAKFLITKGADINDKCFLGKTPLIMVSKWHSADSYTAPIIKLLLDFGADINALDSYGKTAFDYAEGEEEFKKKLLLAKNTSERNVICNAIPADMLETEESNK